MKNLLRPSLVLLAALVAASCILVSSCVLVHVDSDVLAEDWLGDVVHGGETAPTGFRHGEVDFSLAGTVFGLRSDLEMDFTCDADELDAYFESVCREVEVELVEERNEGYVVRSSAEGPRTRLIEYDGRAGRGSIEVRVAEKEEPADLGYRLTIAWRE